MDGRHYNGVQVVAAGQFTATQRQRLEAFTAAVALLPTGTPLDDLLRTARFIAGASCTRPRPTTPSPPSWWPAPWANASAPS